MEKYVTYHCTDFASDDAFVEWVQNPDPESDAFWTALIASYPALKDEIDDARLIIQSMHFVEPELSAEQVNRLWCSIRVDTARKKTPVLRYLSIGAACAASIAILFSIWLQPVNNDDITAETDTLVEFATGTVPVITGNQVQVTLADQSNYSVASEQSELQYDEKGQLTVNAQEVISQQEVKTEKVTEKIRFNQVMVPWGKRTTISFADGTRLWLNAGSRAVYPVEFSSARREVFIEGEAYFEVAKDPAKPFFVKTGTIEVQVLGTSFNVNAYPQEEKMEVALVTGSLQVTGNNMQPVLLRPNHVMEIDQSTSRQVVRSVDIYNYICWKDGVLQFSSENLEVVLRRLERHYAVPVIIKTPLDKYVISGKLDLTDYITGTLSIIEKLAPIRYKFDHNKVFIYKK